MKNLLLLFTSCLTLNLSAQNNPPGASPIHQQFSDLRNEGILSMDDVKINEDQFKPIGRLSASLTPQRKSPTDAIQLQDSIYTWDWDSALNDWIFYSKTTDITYDANYNISGFTDSEWDGLDWVKTYQYAFTYDANHNTTSYTRRSWDGLSWQNEAHVAYGYDASNNRISILAQNWNGTEWVGYLRYTYTFNENNNETSWLVEQWNNDTWVNYIQQITTYDPSYNPIHVLLQTWLNDAWENTKQTTTSYDDDNNPGIILEENWDGTSWVNAYQSAFLYDAANNLTSEVFLIWDGTAWQNGSFFTYTYDANNNLLTELYQSDDNGVWINDEYTTSTYDASNKLIAALLQEWNGFGWEDVEQYFYAYDSGDNLIAFDIKEWLGEWLYLARYGYNYDENDFQRYSVYQSFDLSGIPDYGDSTHYYYRTITAIGDVLPSLDLVTISPNPANSLITISSENEISGINVFSLLGKKIYTSEKTGNLQTNEIDISTWPAGIYLVQILEGDKRFIKKLLVQ